MLLDDVHVSEGSADGQNIVNNPGFEDGKSRWRFWPGTHEESDVVEGDAHSGERALLVSASGRGENWYNNIEHDFTNPRLIGNRVYHVKYWAKWQRGTNRRYEL